MLGRFDPIAHQRLVPEWESPGDEHELATRSSAAESKIEELAEVLEERHNLDPMLLDHLRDALVECRGDPAEAAREQVLAAVADFIAAAVHAQG